MIYGVPFTASFRVWDKNAGVPTTSWTGGITLQLIRDGIAATPTYTPYEPQSDLAPGIGNLFISASEAEVQSLQVAGIHTDSNTQIFGNEYTADNQTIKNLDTTLEADGIVYRFTENALELAPSAGINPNTTVDGDVTWGDSMKVILAQAVGKHAINSDGSVERYRQDGSTIAVKFDKTTDNLFTPSTVNYS